MWVCISLQILAYAFMDIYCFLVSRGKYGVSMSLIWLSFILYFPKSSDHKDKFYSLLKILWYPKVLLRSTNKENNFYMFWPVWQFFLQWLMCMCWTKKDLLFFWPLFRVHPMGLSKCNNKIRSVTWSHLILGYDIAYSY